MVHRIREKMCFQKKAECSGNNGFVSERVGHIRRFVSSGIRAYLLLQRDLSAKKDAVTESCGSQTVGDEQRSFSSRHLAVFHINIIFSDGVQGCGWLVQQEKGSVFIQGPGQHQTLGFAAGKFHSVFIDQPADAGIHSTGQTCDLFRKACFFQTILYSGSVNALHFLCHVFGNAGFQNGKVLKNGGKQSVIVAAVILPDILSVQENPPFRWVKKTAYKADQSGFSGAVETDNGEFFPGWSVRLI